MKHIFNLIKTNIIEDFKFGKWQYLPNSLHPGVWQASIKFEYQPLSQSVPFPIQPYPQYPPTGYPIWMFHDDAVLTNTKPNIPLKPSYDDASKLDPVDDSFKVSHIFFTKLISVKLLYFISAKSKKHN